ncbi:hypothetical protein BC835DRAFT_1027897 [Cytidiella melzeri]|nr:hypothetical protein BC835DRAFT_1027897 [Cytidiella melzeri]
MEKYTNPTNFVRKLYGDEECWISSNEARQGYDWMWQRIGNEELINPDYPVGHAENPNWRWVESWRALNTWSTLRTLTADKPVAAFLGSLDNTDKLTKAMWPEQLQKLLQHNEEVICTSERNWVGFLQETPTPKFKPFPGVNVVNATPSNIRYYQTGAIGPVCIEAAFILATQLAGINWKTLRTKCDTVDHSENGVYWNNAILTKKANNIVKEAHRTYERNLGCLSNPGGTKHGPNGSVSAGFVLAFDVDPDLPPDLAERRNVFLFVGHVIDPESRLHVPDEAKLRSMQYSEPFEPKGEPPNGPAQGTHVHFYSHAHAAVMSYKTWNSHFDEQDKKMKDYDQIGETHIYFLPENEPTGSDLWPRAAWLKDQKK